MAARKTMLTLKAGISMRRNETRYKDVFATIPEGRTGAFTFIEVMIALAVVSISLLALLRLHLMSARMVDRAQMMSQAVFLADEKIAETQAVGFPEEGVRSGAVEKNGLTLNWQTKVTNVQSVQWDAEEVAGLREVLVDISWKQGISPGHLQMSTYVADRKIQ